ncbi:MAG: 4Fe-4S dicluster domain-containing protein [Desulfobacteraceae bacterium]|nr:MAG: 4Fe-4S dicluster domain-containing protein [Desulfobacteraceae bacterium]
MLGSIVLMGGLGVAIGAILVVASKAFYVYEDPKVVAITEAFPGANCGGCGQPGCSANAEAVVKGEADVNSCVAAGDDVAMAIAEIMGVAITDKEPEFADLGCYYSVAESDVNYTYSGITDCRAATMLSGGMKTCRIGCLGLGTCVTACMFDALKIGDSGLPEVDQEKCTGCGACERICPKGIIKLTSTTRRIMREYTLNDCVTPCQRACPTGIDIREYVRLIKLGEYKKSLEVIKERNPFPTVISRICPATCEMGCRRLLQDESVSINHLKRFVCDQDMDADERAIPYKAPSSGKKVAVIGGGVEGLSAAFFAARLGHDATVFESTASLGGILRQAISRKRLKMDILDWDIQGVEAIGVDIKTGMKAGTDFSIWELMEQGYDAVFTATGGWDSRLTRNEANEIPLFIPGTRLLIDLLRNETRESSIRGLGKRVALVGGEANAADTVELLKESGVETITLISRAPAGKLLNEETLSGLKAQGVTVLEHSGVTKLSGTREGLDAVECMDLSTREKEVLSVDTLILASGRMPELVFYPVMEDTSEESETDTRVLTGEWEAVELIKPPEENQEMGLLSEHDVISEYNSAVAAINGGRKAAAALHHVIYGIEFQDTANLVTRHSIIQDVDALEQVSVVPRNIILMNTDPNTDHLEAFEGYSTEVATHEAGRCLRCGLLCYERSKPEDS